MAPGWAVLLVLVLSPPRMLGAEPEPGQPQGGQWLGGAAGQDLPLSRGKRDAAGLKSSATTAMPGHSPTATAVIGSDASDGGSVPPPAPSTNASLLRAPAVPTTTDLDDETDSPEPELLLTSAPSPAVPSTNSNLNRALVVSTTADPTDETDSPEPELLLSSAPPPAVPSTNSSLNQALVVPTTSDPTDETDSPDPDLLQGSEPSASAAPQKSGISTTAGWLTSSSKEGTVADGMDITSSTGPPPTTPAALGPATTGSRKVKKAGAPTAPIPSDTTLLPWDRSGAMGKCLLALLLMGLVAATFLVCSGVLGALLWRRARTGQRRLSRTEMVCISSLLADAEAAAGPRPVPARRHKLLQDGSSEPDGDNLTLSSFLPEHS